MRVVMRLTPGLFGQPRAYRASVASGRAGYAMVALLVGLSIMAVMLSVALPTWRTLAQREREAELVFRGQQYARAIALFQRKYANSFPPTLDMLVDQKFLRRKYIDPVTGGEFQLLYVGEGQGQARGQVPGQAGNPGLQGRGGGTAAPSGMTATPMGGRAGIMGVTSKSTAASMREFNGRTKYNEWAFVAVQATTRAGAPDAGPTPGGGGGGGAGGGRGVGPQGPGAPVAAPGPGRVGPPGDGGVRPSGGNQPFGSPRPLGRP